jgi:hypothetical protein
MVVEELHLPMDLTRRCKRVVITTVVMKAQHQGAEAVHYEEVEGESRLELEETTSMTVITIHKRIRFRST